MPDFTYLKMAETRYNSLLRFNQSAAECSRFKFIVEDLKSQFSESDLIQYEKNKAPIETSEERKRRSREEFKMMEMNKDSNSI